MAVPSWRPPGRANSVPLQTLVFPNQICTDQLTRLASRPSCCHVTSLTPQRFGFMFGRNPFSVTQQPSTHFLTALEWHESKLNLRNGTARVSPAIFSITKRTNRRVLVDGALPAVPR